MNMGWQDPHVARQQRQREQQNMPWAQEPRTIDLTWIGFATCVAALAFVGAAFAGWL